MKKVLIALVILALAVGGYFLFFNDAEPKEPAKTTPTTNTQPTENTDTTQNQQTTSASTITYDGRGFSPATITVKSGSQVTVKNTSSEDLDFESDPHPTHTDNTELNAGLVAAGESKTFTVTNKGSFGYHNHLDQTETGRIIVQ